MRGNKPTSAKALLPILFSFLGGKRPELNNEKGEEKKNSKN